MAGLNPDDILHESTRAWMRTTRGHRKQVRGSQGWAEFEKWELAFGGIRASVLDDNQVLGIVVTAGQWWDVINAPHTYSENGTSHFMLHALYHG